jgi:quercetin dioxygenase-like cupin family protein
MKITKITETPKDPTIEAKELKQIMTGPVTALNLAPGSTDFIVNLVNFSTGTRNKFHAHTCDQVLIVTAGRGIVATETEERIVTPGDVIYFPAGEVHRHGAAKDSEFSHIFILKETTTKQIEK